MKDILDIHRVLPKVLSTIDVKRNNIIYDATEISRYYTIISFHLANYDKGLSDQGKEWRDKADKCTKSIIKNLVKLDDMRKEMDELKLKKKKD